MKSLQIQFLRPCLGIKAFELLQASLWQHPTTSIKIMPLDITSPCDGIIVSGKPPADPEQFKHSAKVFLCNGDEPIAIGAGMPRQIGNTNTWLLCNAFVTADHALREKVIFRSNDLALARQYWTNGIFPMWHENQRHRSITKSRNFWAINGLNRSWRHHVFNNLLTVIPDLVLHSEISPLIHETKDSWFESEHDKVFKQAVNKMYPVVRKPRTSYYDSSKEIVANSFEVVPPQEIRIPPCYSIMPQYWQSRCVIFPETGWQNCELNVTEKIAKCFFTKCIPFPIGGAKINQLYNQLGYFTAWNLLPEKMQVYDDELDHLQRYDHMITAIKYLHDHHELLYTDLADSMVTKNYINFLNDQSDRFVVEKLRDIFSIDNDTNQFRQNTI